MKTIQEAGSGLRVLLSELQRLLCADHALLRHGEIHARWLIMHHDPLAFDPSVRALYYRSNPAIRETLDRFEGTIAVMDLETEVSC